jgi:hypothetical protein
MRLGSDFGATEEREWDDDDGDNDDDDDDDDDWRRTRHKGKRTN